MTLVLVFFCLVVAGLIGLGFYSNMKAAEIDAAYPPMGEFAEIDGVKIHYVDQSAASPQATTLVMIHGASGNIRDMQLAFAEPLKAKYRIIYLDRPGHGWSERPSRKLSAPSQQATLVAGLMDHLGIEEAVVVGHSWGASVAAAFGVLFPEKTAGLLFSSSAAYPWPGGVKWFYNVATTPILGWLFTRTISLPAGLGKVEASVESSFSPDKVPANYAEAIGAKLVLTPRRFQANSEDVADLKENVLALSPRYREIKAPTTVITGTKDSVVYSWIHSEGLARDIEGAKYVEIKEAGHMPHHIYPEIYAREIEELVQRIQPEENIIRQSAR